MSFPLSGLRYNFLTKGLLAILLIPWLWVGGGCGLYDDGETVSEEQERAFQRGKQLRREGRQDDALRSFLSVIERRRGDAPESHLEAADIYLNHEEEPVEAIYHYRRYLEQKPDSQQAGLVEGQIDRAMKELARMLPGDPFQYSMERLDLLAARGELDEENRRLTRELAGEREARAALQEELEESEGRLARAESRLQEMEEILRRLQEEEERRPPAASEVAEANPPQEEPEETSSPGRRTRTYTVQSGDSLYRISVHMYGTGSRWREIYEANRDILPDENSVQAGMELEIPMDN